MLSRQRPFVHPIQPLNLCPLFGGLKTPGSRSDKAPLGSEILLSKSCKSLPPSTLLYIDFMFIDDGMLFSLQDFPVVFAAQVGFKNDKIPNPGKQTFSHFYRFRTYIFFRISLRFDSSRTLL
jgi:hypothetical protein